VTSPVPSPLSEKTLQYIAHVTQLADNVLASIKDLKITDDEEYESLVENLKEVKRVMSELEETRTGITKPMNDELRAINAQFADPMSRLQFIEKQMKIASTNYVAEKRAEQQRMLAEAAAAARTTAANGGDVANVVAQMVNEAAAAKAPVVSGVSFSERWEWSVTDLSLIPREYLRVDESKVNGAVKAGVRSIPGLHIFPTTTARVVAGK